MEGVLAGMRHTEGHGKKQMIHYICDYCRTAEVFDHTSLVLRRNHDASTTVMWDICGDCAEKVKELLAEGRKIEPLPESLKKAMQGGSYRPPPASKSVQHYQPSNQKEQVREVTNVVDCRPVQKVPVAGAGVASVEGGEGIDKGSKEG